MEVIDFQATTITIFCWNADVADVTRETNPEGPHLFLRKIVGRDHSINL